MALPQTDRPLLNIAAVKYLNTLPMLHGLSEMDDIKLLLEDPAGCARLLLDGSVEISLCPIGALIDIPQYHIVSNYGIGSYGKVRTVAVYSHRPIEELKAIKLYGESRSSNLLVQVLDQQFWRHGFEFLPADSLELSPDIGLLCIGDACFDMENRFAYVTDLGEEWTRYTGLPFVFACWVSLLKQDEAVLGDFDKAIAHGIENMDILDLPMERELVDIRQYLRHNIRYKLDEGSRKAMQMFARYSRELNEIHTNVAPNTP